MIKYVLTFYPGMPQHANTLAKERDIEMLWIPGHKEIRDNEIIEELARLLLICPEPAVGIS